MKVELADIPDVKIEWQTEHSIKAMVINNRSPSLHALINWKKDNIEDYKRLLRSMRLACQNKRVLGSKYVKACRNKKYPGTYEMIAPSGKPRLFFFYSQFDEEIIICTHGWDKKSTRKEQNIEFEKCFRLKNLYEEYFDEK